MKEFDVEKWVNDSYVRKAYAELGLDYDKQRASFDNYEVKGEDKFCNKPITEARKAGEIWVDGEPIQPFSSTACTLGAYADLKAKGKKINMAYIYDTARGTKLFADQAFFTVGAAKRYHTVPAQEGRRGACRKDRRQGRQLHRRAEVGDEWRLSVERVALKPGEAEPAETTACRRGIARRRPRRHREPPQQHETGRRWFALNRGRLRAVLFGALALALSSSPGTC